jgi:hypothetical protein
MSGDVVQLNFLGDEETVSVDEGRNKRKLSGGNGDNERQEADFYPTPAYVSRALFENEEFEGSIWECACGDGRLAKVIKEFYPDNELIATDLYNRGYGVSGVNFLTDNDIEADNIVTNPPFDIAYEFILRGISKISNGKLALLLPIRYLTGIKRGELFRDCTPSKVIVIPNKVDFLGNGNPMMEFGWFIWRLKDRKSTSNYTKLIWSEYFKHANRNQRDLFEEAV